MAADKAAQKQGAYRVTGKPVKLGKATLQRRADPVTIRDLVSGKLKGEIDSATGGIILNGQHTFLEAMPKASWFKIRTVNGKRRVFFILRLLGLQPIEYGPFPDEVRALWTLDRLYHEIADDLGNPEQFDKGPWSQEQRRRKRSRILSLVG
jgi:hypothetical protein